MPTFKVLSSEFSHETNTFSKVVTNIDSFKQQCFYTTCEEVRKARYNTRTAVGATYELAEKYDWDLHLPVAATSNPSGKVLDETFETICDLILQTIVIDKVNYDGILLHLHGAMVSISHEDAEGELLRRIRSLIGYKIPIVCTLDLHGNITKLMASTASALIAVQTYPHIDFYERSLEGGELLQKMMEQVVTPYTTISKPPLLKGLDGGRTQEGCPLHYLIKKAEDLKKYNADIKIISLCSGFSAADIFDIGPSCTITVDISNAKSSEEVEALQEFAQGIADELMEYAWETRAFTSVNHLSTEVKINDLN